MNSAPSCLKQIGGIIVSMLFLMTTAQAASFDCGKAKSEVEKIICSNSELSRLDESLNKAYLKALKQNGIKEQTIKSQRQWLKNKRNVCQNAECLRKAYKTRIKQLGLPTYGVVTSRPQIQSTSSPRATVDLSKPQVIESPVEVIVTKTQQQHQSMTGAANNTTVSNKLESQAVAQRKPRKKIAKGERDHISLVDDGKIAFELDFEQFKKERDFRDAPFVFSSAEAEKLWTFLVSKQPELKVERKVMGSESGSFAKLGSDSYLIQHYAFFYARPKQNILTELTPSLPMENYDIGKIRRLGKNKFWLLLSGGNYDHDVGS
jgi:uncharacterized protein